jgi:hypothetical protein
VCSAVSKYLGHLPEGLVEFHILIDALIALLFGIRLVKRKGVQAVAGVRSSGGAS